MTAVIIISLAFTYWGVIILLMASVKSHKVIVRRKMTEAIVPMISALCHPKVSSFDASLKVILSAIMEIPNPTTSDAK